MSEVPLYNVDKAGSEASERLRGLCSPSLLSGLTLSDLRAIRFPRYLCRPGQPHGGPRPIHRKSVCPRAIISGPHLVQIQSRYPLELRGGEIFVSRRVVTLPLQTLPPSVNIRGSPKPPP